MRPLSQCRCQQLWQVAQAGEGVLVALRLLLLLQACLLPATPAGQGLHGAGPASAAVSAAW